MSSSLLPAQRISNEQEKLLLSHNITNLRLALNSQPLAWKLTPYRVEPHCEHKMKSAIKAIGLEVNSQTRHVETSKLHDQL